MDGIRFIHTADLHLDSPFLGLSHLPKELFSRILESTFSAFEKVIDVAIEEAVDFIIIVGDLFDGEDRSIKAQSRFRKQMERLHDAGISAFITYGNHDHLSGNWIAFDMPENVHLFGKEIEMIPFTSKQGCKVHLYGFSYEKRHIVERKILSYEKIGQADIHIGLLHGHCEGRKSIHQPYAPFTIQELLQKEMDYWALGHIHMRQVLHESPYVVYPGNIQGRHKNEQGNKGCYLVELPKNGLSELTFINTATIQWEAIDIYFHENITLSEIYSKCKAEMETMLEAKQQSIMLAFHLHFPSHLSSQIQQVIENGELLEMLQDGIDFHDLFVWPYSLHKNMNDLNTGLMDSFVNNLEATIEEMMEEDVFEQTVSSLFSHIYGSRFLIKVDDEEKKELYDDAKELIVASIGISEGRKE